MMGGLGFFFYGMQTMSEGLRKVAGERLKSFLHMVTSVPIVGVLIGAMITCLIQSSSATTIMVVGFVNAGLLELRQAISVIIGANIGTTITAWMVSSMAMFDVTQYSLPFVAIGFMMSAFAKSRKTKFWGEALLGLAMLFVGLGLLTESVDPLQDSQWLKDLIVLFSDNPLLGVLAGVFITMILQSSSVTVALLQILAFKGLITFDAAVPLILGDNIGTTIKAQLAAVGANLNARRAAMSHTMFNVIGVSYMIVFVYFGWYQRFIDFIIPGPITLKNIMVYMAVAHTIFNVVNAIVFLPLIGWLEKISIALVPQKKGVEDLGPQYLERHLLDTPPVAMQQIHNEIIYMLTVARKAVETAIGGFLEKDEKLLTKALSYERATDNLQSEITQYVIELSQRELAPEESQEIPVLLHNVNDIERIGDHAKNITEIAQSRIDQGIQFSDVASAELVSMWDELRRMIEGTKMALEKNDDKLAVELLDRENRINELQVKLKESHICRLNDGECHLKSNFIFLDFIDNIEKIADHLTNIIQGVIGKMQWRMYKKEMPLNHPS